jgi:hypothetical protein
MTPADVKATTDLVTALWSIGGGSLGGVVLTLLGLRLLGSKNGKKTADSLGIVCPMNPGLLTLNEKVDKLISEQVRANTYLAIMANEGRK